MQNNRYPLYGFSAGQPQFQQFRDVNLLQDPQGLAQIQQAQPVVLNRIPQQQAPVRMLPPQMGGEQPVIEQATPQYAVNPNGMDNAPTMDDYMSRMYGYNLAQKRGDTYLKQAEQIEALPTRGYVQGGLQGILQALYYNKARNAYNQDWERISNIKDLQNQNKNLLSQNKENNKRINTLQKTNETLLAKQNKPALLDIGTNRMAKKIVNAQQQAQANVVPQQAVQLDPIQRNEKGKVMPNVNFQLTPVSFSFK